MKKAFSYFLVFVGLQLVGGAVVQTLWQLLSGSTDKTAAMLVTMTGSVSVITIVVFLWSRWTQVSPNWLRTRPWTVLVWSVVASFGALVPSAWIQEQMPELPNLAEDTFDTLLGSPVGYVTIGLLAPLTEELVMRGAILRSLLKDMRPWLAIVLSALLFALVHMNPVQMPHAFLIGLLLGWMYWRTGSILPGVAYHWANNSVAFVLYHFYPSDDTKLIDIFQTQQHVLMAVGFSLLILLPALYQLHLWMRRADD